MSRASWVRARTWPSSERSASAGWSRVEGSRRSRFAPASPPSPAETLERSTKPPWRSVTRTAPSATSSIWSPGVGERQRGAALHLAVAHPGREAPRRRHRSDVRAGRSRLRPAADGAESLDVARGRLGLARTESQHHRATLIAPAGCQDRGRNDEKRCGGPSARPQVPGARAPLRARRRGEPLPQGNRHAHAGPGRGRTPGAAGGDRRAAPRRAMQAPRRGGRPAARQARRRGPRARARRRVHLRLSTQSHGMPL